MYLFHFILLENCCLLRAFTIEHQYCLLSSLSHATSVPGSLSKFWETLSSHKTALICWHYHGSLESFQCFKVVLVLSTSTAAADLPLQSLTLRSVSPFSLELSSTLLTCLCTVLISSIDFLFPNPHKKNKQNFAFVFYMCSKEQPF